MTLGIGEIIGIIAGGVMFILSAMVKSERGKRKDAETRADAAEAEAMNANQRSESTANLQEIEHARHEADDEAESDLLARDISNRKPFGMYNDD